MILTEKEAAEKWCPFARVMTQHSNAAGNIGADTDRKTMIPLGHCFGSRCMAWRLEDDGRRIAPARTSIRKDDGTLEYITPDKPPTDPGWGAIKSDGGMVTGFVRSLTPRGVCGLAHKP